MIGYKSETSRNRDIVKTQHLYLPCSRPEASSTMPTMPKSASLTSAGLELSLQGNSRFASFTSLLFARKYPCEVGCLRIGAGVVPIALLLAVCGTGLG